MSNWNAHDAFLMHHGIKGQRKGVRHGPPYPLSQEKHDRVIKSGTMIKDALKAGTISTNLNVDKQKRHTLSDHIDGRSFMDGDEDFCQKWIDRLSGTGIAKLDRNGKWTKKEMVRAPRDIGTFVNPDGSSERSNAMTIIYSNTGTHIFPRRKTE